MEMIPSPRLGFLRGVFLASRLASNQNNLKTEHIQTKTIQKRGRNKQQYSVKHAKIYDTTYGQKTEGCW